ncbi:M48 family metalloprotease [Micromonospora sp. 067-2]|uniref:M48 family metalloprotease n=1 Tax=Micromonospora sp. 067-2 TaxID=2789270 RepID=UPI00397C837F
MTIAVYLPLLLALPLTVSAGWLVHRGTPTAMARALAAVALVAGAASTWSLTMLALTLLDDVPPLSALDDHPTVELPEPVPGPVALVAALVLLGGAVRLLAELRQRAQTVRLLHAIGVPQDGLVVADWSTPLAVAVPGRWGQRGHLLITTGILRLLDGDERQVLFAHEHAHLTHRHHRLTSVAAAAAAVNPLLIPVRQAVAYLVEREADEDAAVAVADRDLTAQAVARAALASVTAGPTAALGIHGGGAVVRRVRALNNPAPIPRKRPLIAAVLLAAGLFAAVTTATVQFVALARAWL